MTHKPIRLFPNIRSHTRPLDASISMFCPCERKSGENSTRRKGGNREVDRKKNLAGGTQRFHAPKLAIKMHNLAFKVRGELAK